MSIKTLRKRITTLVVVALIGGALSVVTTPVANAAAGDVAGDIWVSTGVSAGNVSAGVCSVYDGVNDSFSTISQMQRNHESLLATPLTITMAVGGSLDVRVVSSYWTATSGGVITHGDTDAEVLHSSYGLFAGADTDTMTLTASSVGTVTLNSYATAPFSAVNTANTVLATPNGTLTIEVVSQCVTVGYSSTYSAYRIDGTAHLPANGNITRTYGDTVTFGAGSDAFISIIGKNDYDAALPATTTWVASATNDAKVLFGTSSTSIGASTTARGTLSTISTTAAGDNVYVRVNPANRAVGGKTVVTVTAGGVTVLSKEITFLPEAAKLVVVKNASGSLVYGDGALIWQLQDAEGKAVPGSVAVRSATLDSRVTSVTQLAAAAIQPAVPGGTIATAAGAATATATALLGSATATTTYGISKFACNTGSTAGSTKVTLRYTGPVSATNIDTDVTLNCAGGLATYTVSTDKAAYKIGEVATITITGKDSSGAAVSDFTVMPTADALSVGGGTLIKNTATTDAFTGGVKTYQAQLTTAGTFNVVSTIAGAVTKSGTAAYTVTGSAVTNEEVLAAIVKLIASINKQIRALQKSLKR